MNYEISIFLVYRIGRIITICLFLLLILTGYATFFLIQMIIEVFLATLKCSNCKHDISKDLNSHYSFSTFINNRKCIKCGKDLTKQYKLYSE